MVGRLLPAGKVSNRKRTWGVTTRKSGTIMKFVYYLIATGLGTGYSPIAPGTAGSLLSAVIIYYFSPVNPWLLMVLIGLFFLAGVYSGNLVEKKHGHDPQIVVLDEMVGMAISLLFLPKNWILFVIAFILFRIFDIAKPPPVQQSQKLKGGWGIMLDDVLAGSYALLIIQLIRIFL